MSQAAALPAWIAVLVSVLVVLGAAFALLGAVGLLRLATFYERLHPPTMATTLGLGFTLLASMILFTALESRPVLHEVVIAAFVVLTTPVSVMLLVGAARHRDRAGGRDPTAGAEQGTSPGAMREP